MGGAEAVCIDLKVSYKVVNNAFYILPAGGDGPLEVIVIYHIKSKELRFLFLCIFSLQILLHCLSTSQN